MNKYQIRVITNNDKATLQEILIDAKGISFNKRLDDDIKTERFKIRFFEELKDLEDPEKIEGGITIIYNLLKNYLNEEKSLEVNIIDENDTFVYPIIKMPTIQAIRFFSENGSLENDKEVLFMKVLEID